jgi:hypothetical protein
MAKSISLRQAMQLAERDHGGVVELKSHGFNVQEINGHQIAMLIYQADYSEENGAITWSELRYSTFVDGTMRSGGVFSGVFDNG